MDDLLCYGNETNLSDCEYLKQHNCAHEEDAGCLCVVDGKKLSVLWGSGGKFIGIVSIPANIEIKLCV